MHSLMLTTVFRETSYFYDSVMTVLYLDRSRVHYQLLTVSRSIEFFLRVFHHSVLGSDAPSEYDSQTFCLKLASA